QQFADMMVSAPIKAMCLHVAHDCNLRCKYCFASTGDFGVGRKLLDEATGKKAIDFLLEHSNGRRNIELDFFGGEPLMNMPVVKAVVKYARSKEKEYNKNFRFTITTNGVLLDDENIDFINKEMSNVVLSIDGRKEVNDNMRPAINGKGSYDIIMPKFKDLVEKRGKDQYYVRGTFTKHNLDVINLNQEGFDQISVEPVVADKNAAYAITETDLPRVFEEYENLAKHIIETKQNGTGFNFFHFMLDLDQGPCAIKRLRGCGCGNEYVAVTPDGDIYPCHQFVGMNDWKMGSVYDGSLNLDMKNDFAKANVYSKEECSKCWAKFYCSGGCNANNLQYAGGILNPHKLSCDLEKKRLECAIMIKAALA
ncbi:MAG: thioether cross-link-forming SCIFF peptide maturase, partial [Oscillospiraceae bacterium]